MADNPQVFDFPIGSVIGPQGETGNGISSITLVSTSGLAKTYRITMTDETTFDFVVNDGNGITGVTFNTETNTITFTFDDGPAFTTPSLKGAKGDDGVSPAVTVTTITGGHRVTITDATHPSGQSFDVMDGASDAGDVTYDSTATYGSGTVGAELTELSRQLSYKVDDVLIDGASIVSDGMANIPVATSSVVGVSRADNEFGTGMYGNRMVISCANDAQIKESRHYYRPIVPDKQHQSVFYGLAKAAGDTTQSESANAVGAYTEDAKSKIHTMLNGPVAVSGTTPTIAAKDGITYICGEVATLDITLPASGIFEVQFVSGSTPTVLTATGVSWVNGFDPTVLEANKTYDISISNGIGVAVWV